MKRLAQSAHCENCKWFGGYTGVAGGLLQAYYCNDPKPPVFYSHYEHKHICNNYEERKLTMDINELLNIPQPYGNYCSRPY